MYQNFTLLYLEDEYSLARDTIPKLEQMGFKTVLIAHDLKRAEAHYQAHQIHAALLDVHIGRAKSSDLARELTDRGARVVLTSGYSREELGHTVADGAFVQKPFSVNDLHEAFVQLIPAEHGDVAAE